MHARNTAIRPFNGHTAIRPVRRPAVGIINWGKNLGWLLPPPDPPRAYAALVRQSRFSNQFRFIQSISIYDWHSSIYDCHSSIYDCHSSIYDQLLSSRIFTFPAAGAFFLILCLFSLGGPKSRIFAKI